MSDTAVIEAERMPLPKLGALPRLVYLMSLASGASALIYEVAWTRMLALTFGSTTLAASAVIAGFMGGMGLGAWLFHRASRRALARGVAPLAIYAALEFLIAVSTALLSPTFYSLPDVFLTVAGWVGGGAPLLAARFLLSFVVLLVPALLMGATFPALCTAMIRSARGADRHLGMIYGLNTVGAALGAAAAGLFLIERFGLLGAVTVANFVNLAVALTALYAARLARAAASDNATADAAEAHPQDAALATTLPAGWTAATLFLSGWATLSYEILWFRGLRYLVGNSTYALTVVLVVFLVGLGLGALLLRRVIERGRPERDLALSQCLIAALAIVAIAALYLIVDPPGKSGWLNALADQLSIFSGKFRAVGWQSQLALNAAVAATILLPSTLVMGLVFPLATRLMLGDVQRTGQSVGRAYFLANLGSISGAILAATVLLPQLGTIEGTKLVAHVSLAWGLILFGVLRVRQTGSQATPAVASSVWTVLACLAITIGLTVILPHQMQLRGERGVYHIADILFTAEGDLATVQVLEDPVRPKRKAMAIDGAVIGCTPEFDAALAAKQAVLAQLPLTLDARARRTLNVGLGSASTLAELSRYPELQTLDCVEINAGVVEGARRHFPEAKVFNDPRARVVVEDALHFLLQAPADYDVIISDGKQNPDFPGNAVMLCREFYAYSLARLAPEGLFVQWLKIDTLSSEFTIVLRTFCDVFPQADFFFFPDKSVLMVGGREPLFGRPRLQRAAFDAADGARNLTAYGIDQPDALVAHWLADRAGVQAVVGPGPLATWNHNPLEFSTFKASRAELEASVAANMKLLWKAHGLTQEDSLLKAIDPALAESTLAIQEMYVMLGDRKLEAARRSAEKALAAAPDYPAALHAVALMKRIFAAQDMPWQKR